MWSVKWNVKWNVKCALLSTEKKKSNECARTGILGACSLSFQQFFQNYKNVSHQRLKKKRKNPFMKEISAYLHLLFEVWGHIFQPFWGSTPYCGLLLVPFFWNKNNIMMVENKYNKWVNSSPHTTSFLQTECLCVCVCALVTTPFVAFQDSSDTNKLTDRESQLTEGKPVGHFTSAALDCWTSDCYF